MKKEVSAGGVVVQKHAQKWEVLLMKDMNGNWTFPKGLVEPNEKPEEAAIREIQEEVGLTALTAVAALAPIEYWYKRNSLIQKTVYYFLYQYRGRQRPVVQKEEGISEARWFSFIEALEVVGYPKTNRQLIKKTKEILSKTNL